MDKEKINLANSLISVNVPSDIFKNRELSVLESLVFFLKKDYKLTNSQIAKLINRDDRTIWTVYNRANKKIESDNSKVQNEK